MEWIPPKTITGSPAENERYLRREYINNEFWRHIKNGEHIVFSAPRRVGKTSIMKDLEKNCPKSTIAVYHNIESDSTQKEFFKRLFNLLINSLDKHQKYLAKLDTWLKTKSLGEINTKGIKIEHRDLDYKEALLDLFEMLGKEDTRFVFFLDEFPDVIRSIERKEGKDAAIETLHTLRAIRHNEKLKNFTFVFAGSIGIHHVVVSLDRQKLINDLYPIHIEPLTTDEANDLITQLLDGATMQIGNAEKDYLLLKTDHLLPFYIQLMIEKCDFILHRKKSPDLNKNDIDTAFQIVIKEGRNFDDWESRLKRYLNPNDAKYCIGVLTRSAHKEPYSIQEVYNYSKVQVPITGYKELLDNVLEKDGYILNEDNRYRFLSPFLKEWWKNRHPEFEIEN